MNEPPLQSGLVGKPSTQIVGLHQPPPASHTFVGRTAELAAISRALQNQGVVALEGIAGSGKSILVSVAAQQSDRYVGWIEIMPGLLDNGRDLYWQLVQPLAVSMPAAFDRLYQILHDHLDYPLSLQVQWLLEAYEASPQPHIICIDGISATIDAGCISVIRTLAQRLERTTSTKLVMILSGRTIPILLQTYALSPLRGIEPDEIIAWGQQRDLNLDMEQALWIAHETGGLPYVISLLFDVMGRSTTPNIPLVPINRIRRIERFLLSLIDELTSPERTLLQRLVDDPDQEIIDIEERTHLDRLQSQHFVIQQDDWSMTVHPLFHSLFGR